MVMIQGDIQRLSQGPKLKGKLGAARERDPIPGKVTPFTEDTFAVASTAPAAASNTELECNVNENETEKQENDEVTDPNDPNTFHKGGAGGGSESQEETGMQDIDSAMNDETGNDSIPSEYSDDPLPSTKGFTNLTDENGNCFTVRMDGTFPVPDGWEDADTPPVDENYQEGYYWSTESVNGKPIAIGATPELAVRNIQGISIGGSLVTQTGSSGPPVTKPVVCSSAPSPCMEVSSSPVVSVLTYRESCSVGGLSGAEQALCDADPPTQETWPDGDGCFVLSYKDGTFQTNPYDPNAPEGWEPKSTLYSYEGGVPKYGVTGTANGGYMVYDTNSDKTPNSSGVAKVYDSQGRFTAAGNPTSQFMDQYLPK